MSIGEALESIAPDNIDERRMDEKPDPVECRMSNCDNQIEPTHNPFRECWLEPSEVCEECHRDQERKRRQKERFDRWWEGKAEVPDGLRDEATRDDINLLDILDRLTELHPEDHDSERWAVYLHGPVGTGKSVQCAQAVGKFLARWMLRRGALVSAKYVNTTEFLGRLRDSYGNDGKSVDVETYKDAGLLVLDDLGRERSTPWAAETMYKIIDHRYSERLPTVFASNLSLGELQSGARLLKGEDLHGDFDDRLVDRLWQMCGGSRHEAPDAVRELDTHYRSPRRAT